MDCRRSLQLASLCLFSSSFLVAQGCAPTAQQVIAPPQTPATVEAKKESDLPRITPKASSCVAGAELLRVEANSSKYTQPQRDDFRERARKGYEQALHLDPKNTPAQLGLARLYYDTNDHDRAVAAYQRLLKQDPKNVVALYELGMTHARAKEWEAAIVKLKAAYDIDPDNKQCATTLGHCLARAGRLDEALAVFTKAVGEARAHYNLARML
ncbi:MAG TPA: tetratricopeptide repeat protein, partial [Gemmataceae bacterium]|nr:tetratricopeptide repeat protein [Gemmataceae bacterium]